MTYNELAKELSGRAIAEIIIESKRDAEENGFNSKLNPYKPGTLAALEYTNECQKKRFNRGN